MEQRVELNLNNRGFLAGLEVRRGCLSDEVMVVGARFDDNIDWNAGVAYVYRLTEFGWSEEQKLTVRDRHENQNFGASVSVGRNVIVCWSAS